MEERRIPIVDAAERRRMNELPVSRELHRELYARMPFRDAVEVGRPPLRGGPTRGAGRVLAWNAARCASVEGAARLIAASGAGIVLLTEMDWGMSRSGQSHTTRELAGRLSVGYAYAVEFLELGLGDPQEKARFSGAENSVGYHGAAILAADPFVRVERIPLEESGGWFDPGRGQRRVGGRIALAAVVDRGSQASRGRGGSGDSVTPDGDGPGAARGRKPMLLCSVHLESESDPEERAREIGILLDRIDRDYSGLPVVIGGDFNTFSVSADELDDPRALESRLAEDAGRFANPLPHEPLFELAQGRGYDWRRCNAIGAPTERRDPARRSGGPLRGAMKIDWFLCRGPVAHSPEVIAATDPADGAAISDHDAIAVSIEELES